MASPQSRFLRKTIKLALEVESQILAAHQQTAMQAVVYCTVIAERRLAQAVDKLGIHSAYESHIVLRAMLEHYFNLSWILVKTPQRRAVRFLRYQPVEQYRLAESLPSDSRPPNYPEALESLRERREAVKRVFYKRDSEGRFKWASSWSTLSFEARVSEVQRSSRNRGQITSFAYSLYRWFSGTVHGSPHHLAELVDFTRRGLRPRHQPVRKPTAPAESAALIVLATIWHASKKLRLARSTQARLDTLLRDTHMNALAAT